MNLRELEEFSLSDAIRFHDTLNPELFLDDHLRSEVRDQLLKIAEDFKIYLGVTDLEIKDIVITGSNAAYTYTPHSDIDLHLITEIEQLNNDEVYQELFNAKKIVYNDRHDIKIKGYDVELYVEDSRTPAKSLGEYSVLKNRWIKYPSKRKTNIDERGTLRKFQKLVQLAEFALRSDDMDNVDELIKTISKYRFAGLSFGGEFSPENLAFKILRSHGIMDKLYDHSSKLHSENLSINEMEDEYDQVPVPMSDVLRIQQATNLKMNQSTNNSFIWLSPTQISGSYTDGELRKLGFKQSSSGNWGGTKRMWDRLYNIRIDESSGYIPSNKEKNDWRWKTALTVDVKSDSIKANASKLGLGKIHRDGRPPIAKSSGKI